MSDVPDYTKLKAILIFPRPTLSRFGICYPMLSVFRESDCHPPENSSFILNNLIEFIGPH